MSLSIVPIVFQPSPLIRRGRVEITTKGWFLTTRIAPAKCIELFWPSTWSPSRDDQKRTARRSDARLHVILYRRVLRRASNGVLVSINSRRRYASLVSGKYRTHTACSPEGMSLTLDGHQLRNPSGSKVPTVPAAFQRLNIRKSISVSGGAAPACESRITGGTHLSGDLLHGSLCTPSTVRPMTLLRK